MAEIKPEEILSENKYDDEDGNGFDEERNILFNDKTNGDSTLPAEYCLQSKSAAEYCMSSSATFHVERTDYPIYERAILVEKSDKMDASESEIVTEDVTVDANESVIANGDYQLFDTPCTRTIEYVTIDDTERHVVEPLRPVVIDEADGESNIEPDISFDWFDPSILKPRSDSSRFENHGRGLILPTDRRSQSSSVPLAISAGAWLPGIEVPFTDRSQEKLDLQTLNKKLSNYLEQKARYKSHVVQLTEENTFLQRRLKEQREELESKYEAEMRTLRKEVEKARSSEQRMRIRFEPLKKDFASLKQRFTESERTWTEQRTSHMQRVRTLEKEQIQHTATISDLTVKIKTFEKREEQHVALIKIQENQLKILENADLKYYEYENQLKTTREEFAFYRKVHEEEIEELQRRASIAIITDESDEFWRTEIKQALAEMQNYYDERIDVIEFTLVSEYNMKIAEMQAATQQSHVWTEIKRYREENGQLLVKVAQLNGALRTVTAEKTTIERSLTKKNQELLKSIEKMFSRMKATWGSTLGIGLQYEIDVYKTLVAKLFGKEGTTGIVIPVDAIDNGHLTPTRDSSGIMANSERRFFIIVSELCGKALDIEGSLGNNGDDIILFNKHGVTNQQWYTDQQGYIRSALRDLAINAEPNKKAEVQPFNGGPNQQWVIEGKRIVNRANRQVLDVSNSETKDGTKILSGDWHGASNQLWKFEYV